MEFDSNRPVYVQILEYLEERIINNSIQMGEKMPSVRELANELKVNPNTVQRAYKDLETIGIISSKRGTGSYVTENKETLDNLKKDLANKIITEFKQKMENIGFSESDIINIINAEKGE